MTKVVVTGGSGIIGRWLIKEFLEQGYEVVNADVRDAIQNLCHTVKVDTSQIGDLYWLMDGADAVVHLAAIPEPGHHPNHVIIHNNVVSTYNLLEAASQLHIRKVAIASSLCAYGMVYPTHPFLPNYLPLDEEHPLLPQDSYGLSKVMDEQSAAAIHRRTGMQVCCLRFTTVITPDQYRKDQDLGFIGVSPSTHWSYVDVRDAARACRLAVEADGLGFVALNIGAKDSGLAVSSRNLVAEYYPGVPQKRPIADDETLFSIERAREMLGFEPAYSWRNAAGGERP